MYQTKQEHVSSSLMELFIETLTGSSMILHVSPLDTVFDVKTYIQKLEGIPASQQHLVWQSSELDDGQSLQDCHVHSGATLRLVLNMRGGPISTRRVPVEEPSMVEYFTEASRSDLLSSASSHRRPVTVVVCQSGDQLKFYQLMPGSNISSPVSCSQSSSEDDVEVNKDVAKPARERREENRRTRDKMKLVRSQMERCSLLKEKKDKLPATMSLLPHPPSSGHSVVINRLRHLSSSATSKKPALLDVNRMPRILPPATASVATRPSDCLEKDLPTVGTNTASGRISPAVEKVIAHREQETPETAVNLSNSSCLSTSEDSLPTEAKSQHVVEEDVCRQEKTVDADGESATCNLAVESTELNVSQPRIQPVSFCKLLKRAESVIKADMSHGSKPATSSGRPPPDDSQHRLNDARSKFASAVATAAYAEQPTPTVMKRARARKDSRMMLRSLDSGETRAMSGLLTSLVQSNSSRLASGGHYQFTRSGKNCSSLDVKLPQASYTKPLAETPAKCVKEVGTSACSSEPSSTQLPTISAPKTSTKRCLVCHKKTSLATSFHCRCGGNFCSWHRCPETHSCSFDYRSEGRRVIEQSNPLVTAEKLPKI